MDVTLANSQLTQSTKLCDIVLEFQGSSDERSRQQQVYKVVQGLAYNFILGMQQLNHFNPAIDWKSRTI